MQSQVAWVHFFQQVVCVTRLPIIFSMLTLSFLKGEKDGQALLYASSRR